MVNDFKRNYGDRAKQERGTEWDAGNTAVKLFTMECGINQSGVYAVFSK